MLPSAAREPKLAVPLSVTHHPRVRSVVAAPLAALVAACAHQAGARALGSAPPAEAAPIATVIVPSPTNPPPQPIETTFTYAPEPESDARVNLEFFKIDRELKERFDFDTGHQHYAGTAYDLYGAHGLNRLTRKLAEWPAALNEHDAYARRLDALAAMHPSPRLMVLLLARRGSLADSLWEGITSLEQRGFQITSSRQRSSTPQPVCVPGHGIVCVAIPSFDDEFKRRRQEDTDYVARLATSAYAWCIEFARQFGVDDASVRRERERLAILRQSFGREQFEAVVAAAPPPWSLAKPDQRVSAAELALMPP